MVSAWCGWKHWNVRTFSRVSFLLSSCWRVPDPGAGHGFSWSFRGFLCRLWPVWPVLLQQQGCAQGWPQKSPWNDERLSGLLKRIQRYDTQEGSWPRETFRSKCAIWFKCFSPSGGYEGYRPSFSNAPSSGYGQTQFNNSRDYSNNTYQRVSLPFILRRNTRNRLNLVTWYCCFKEGYQSYKRGAAQGPRGLSRGNAPSVR